MKADALSRGHAPAGALPRMRALLRRLGHPEEAFPAVHVTGSHGKSSVVGFLEGIFVAAGYRVGTFVPSFPTSPVRIGGEPVPVPALERVLSRVEGAATDGTSPAERLAAAAFSLFADVGVEIAFVGAGIGGRHDPANCLPRRLLTAVTAVEEDRVDLFGPGCARPSWEEARTASSGIPFLTVERRMETLAAFAETTKEVGAALVLLDPEDLSPVGFSWERAVWRSREDPLGLGEFETGPMGLYQRGNLALALGAVCELLGGWDLPPGAIRHGLARVELPVRFEVVSRRPYVVLDAARNPAAARSLIGTLEALPGTGGRRILLFGITRGQPVRATVEVLFPWFDHVVLLSIGGQDALPPQALLPQARRLGVRAEIGGPLPEALGDWLGSADEGDLIVAVGPKGALLEARGELGSVVGRG
ncbi:MAG: hypothetical protein GXO72_04635 [Caldiserica bacterium]|nr:hypothetical protein [Caldisericota bacterium]